MPRLNQTGGRLLSLSAWHSQGRQFSWRNVNGKTLSFTLTLLLTGCAQIQTPLDEGYQFGDTTGSLFDIRDDYCTESDPKRRAIVLALLFRAGVTLPPNGACTDILEAATWK